MSKSGPITGWTPGTKVWVQKANPIGQIYKQFENFTAILLRMERVQDGHEIWLIESESYTNWTMCCASHQFMDIM